MSISPLPSAMCSVGGGNGGQECAMAYRPGHVARVACIFEWQCGWQVWLLGKAPHAVRYSACSHSQAPYLRRISGA